MQPSPRNFRSFFFARFAVVLLFCFVALTPATLAQGDKSSANIAAQKGLEPIQKYISTAWDTLTRSLSDCSTVVDPKLAEASVFYLPADMEIPPAVTAMQEKCHVQVKKLPVVIRHPGDFDSSDMKEHGLLYLDHKYVVPGGRFNEMYGWDSYFIVLGLIRAGRVELAKDMVENFFFEIEHYGTILNANRTYYLTRSQPPFLTSMIFLVYDAQKAAGHEDRAWLEKAYAYASRDYENWNRDPHLAGDTGLSRYYDFGKGPAPESLKDEAGIHRKVTAYFFAHPDVGRDFLVMQSPGNKGVETVGPVFTANICDSAKGAAHPECTLAGSVSLNADYYRGDRSMRESGYDVSFRFGPFGSRTHHFAPVCLNSLLYKSEKDLEKMSDLLGKNADTTKWHDRAGNRKDAIQKYLWDPERGMYFDYDFTRKTRSTYEYITTYFPMWAGVATPAQAASLVKHLDIFERPGGLVMSPYETSGQWDYPYAWAPNQIVANTALRKYNFTEAADRTGYAFLSTIAENFRRDGDIREKYDAVTRSSETAVGAGYHMNVIGFGWTNAAFLQLLHDLPEKLVTKLANEQVQSASAKSN